MAPESSNGNTYKEGSKLGLERLKKKEIQKATVDLTKINIKTLASLIEDLSEDVKLHMKVLTANRYHALNDRTIHLLSQGEVDMSATTAEVGSTPASNTASDAEVVEMLDLGAEVGISVADKKQTRQGCAFPNT